MRFPNSGFHLHASRCRGFTRVDLLVSVVTLAALTLLFLPGIARASLTAVGVSCIDNQRKITSAWQQYATDHGDRLVNNFFISETFATINNGQFDTWALNVVDWTTTSANTNLTLLQNGKLFPYLQGNVTAFKCPADVYRSAAQSNAGWTGRLRSYAMNGFMGKTSSEDSAVNNGQSGWATGKRQFLKTASIPDPGNSIVFLDEHPDGLNDGFFIEFPPQLQWGDIPASHHNGGCGFGFADGHGEIHTWVYPATKQPVRYVNLGLPSVSPSTSGDLVWLTSRMTVDQTALAMNRRTNGMQIAWSALPTNYVLEAAADLSTPVWTPVEPKPAPDYGTKSVTVDAPGAASFFRLHRY